MTANRPTTAAGHGWRHAMWCRWERAEGTCSCGLRAFQDAEARQPDSEALRAATEELARTIYSVDRMIDRISRGKPAAGLYREWTHLVALFAEPDYQGSLDELRDRYLATLPPSDPPA